MVYKDKMSGRVFNKRQITQVLKLNTLRYTISDHPNLNPMAAANLID